MKTPPEYLTAAVPFHADAATHNDLARKVNEKLMAGCELYGAPFLSEDTPGWSTGSPTVEQTETSMSGATRKRGALRRRSICGFRVPWTAFIWCKTWWIECRIWVRRARISSGRCRTSSLSTSTTLTSTARICRKTGIGSGVGTKMRTANRRRAIRANRRQVRDEAIETKTESQSSRNK